MTRSQEEIRRKRLLADEDAAETGYPVLCNVGKKQLDAAPGADNMANVMEFARQICTKLWTRMERKEKKTMLLGRSEGQSGWVSGFGGCQSGH